MADSTAVIYSFDHYNMCAIPSTVTMQINLFNSLFLLYLYTRARIAERYTLNICLVSCKARIFLQHKDRRKEEEEEEEEDGENRRLFENSPISVEMCVCVCFGVETKTEKSRNWGERSEYKFWRDFVHFTQYPRGHQVCLKVRSI